ncbi:MAG: hypothetical protein ACRDL2_06570 [Gaiellaceae bacterium]
MRVFVLTTGRSGSVTFAKACGHIANFSAAHESRADLLGEERFDYPDDHVEVDNRLSWFLGQLATRFPDARYAHLVRDPDAVARSFVARWPRSTGLVERARLLRGHGLPGGNLMAAFANGIVKRQPAWPEAERFAASRFMVDSIEANIREFLRDRAHVTVSLESAQDDFRRFWEWIGAAGDLNAALGEWTIRHNATR